jgi:geranylgeranyl pyrophosphate synthase
MSHDNETDTYEFHEMVDRGQSLFNSLLAQYGKAIHREEQEENTNELLIEAYREHKEYFKNNSRRLVKLGSIEEVYKVIKEYSVIYKSNLEKVRNHKALAILTN